MTDTPESAPSSAAPSLDFNTYISALPDTHKELLTKNGVNSFEAQEKWISNLNSAIGKKGIIPPDEKASDEEKAAYREKLYTELGRPQDGTYEFTLPEGSKSEYYTDEFMNGLADVAFKSGMSAEGYQQLVNFIGTGFNSVLAEWEKTIGEINKKLGEDKMDDSSNTSTQSKDDMHQEARKKMIEANNLYRKGDFKGAALLKKQADDLYSRL